MALDTQTRPLYQVDYSNVATGKRLAISKRRIRWRFGFANQEAVDHGLTGTDCRGEEHEVVLVWGLTSGKRMVFADGKMVHASHSKHTEATFETSWTMPGGHVVKLYAHKSSPFYTPAEELLRQFDLVFDGCSYFDAPKVYQLGTTDGPMNGFAVKPSIDTKERRPVTPTKSISGQSCEETVKSASSLSVEPVDLLSAPVPSLTDTSANDRTEMILTAQSMSSLTLGSHDGHPEQHRAPCLAASAAYDPFSSTQDFHSASSPAPLSSDTYNEILVHSMRSLTCTSNPTYTY